jgi:hypothetical protein
VLSAIVAGSLLYKMDGELRKWLHSHRALQFLFGAPLSPDLPVQAVDAIPDPQKSATVDL